jgi:hypothetical protein
LVLKMCSFTFPDPNAPLTQLNRRERPRILDDAAGDAGHDGYTRLSVADRQSGVRPPIDAGRAWPRRPLE